MAAVEEGEEEEEEEDEENDDDNDDYDTSRTGIAHTAEMGGGEGNGKRFARCYHIFHAFLKILI